MNKEINFRRNPVIHNIAAKSLKCFLLKDFSAVFKLVDRESSPQIAPTFLCNDIPLYFKGPMEPFTPSAKAERDWNRFIVMPSKKGKKAVFSRF